MSEIERLRAEVERLRNLLREISKLTERWVPGVALDQMTPSREYDPRF